MSNSKLIIVEGAQGTGKTTVTDYLRNSMNYTNLYRFGGTSDITTTGKEKATKMYDALLKYLKGLENCNINLVFDRTFFSEENYCRLGFKQYSFTDEYNRILEKFSKLDFEIYYITLYLENEEQFEQRLDRKGKVELDYLKFKTENSIKQQREYLKMADEVAEKYKNMNVLKLENGQGFSVIQKELDKIICN